MEQEDCILTYKGTTYKCAIGLALSIMGGRWKPLILWHLQSDTLRFGQLKKTLETISHKVLTEQLKELESDGMITRKEYLEIPPRVEYSLTEEGRSVLPILEMISKWGAKVSDELSSKDY